MNWLRRVVDGLLWIALRFDTAGVRLRRITREQLAAAKRTADAIVVAAEAEADALRDSVDAQVQLRIEAELAKARKSAKAAVEKSMTQVCQAAVLKARQEALLLAYTEAAASFGLMTTASVEELETRRRDVSIDVNAAYPNIYDTGEVWVVRVLAGDIRHVQVFSYTNKQTKVQRLIDAVRCRNMLAGDQQLQHAAVYEECLVRARQTYGDGPHLHVHAAEQFHVQMVAAGDRADHFRFVGTDPEDRFQIADHAILTEPIATLVNDNRRVLDAFASIGCDRRRTVRDLLLLTGDELTEASGFGEVSLRRLRSGLAQYGLALWGDAAPAASSPPREPGDRNFRAIEFE
jgi:hypothetical protein